MKRFFLIAGAILLLLLVTAIALPFVIDPNRFRPLLETELSHALGREVKLGDLKLSILSGSVTASDLAISDDPAYSRSPFVRAKSLGIGVEVWPLIASRQLHVTGVTIDQPAIVLLQASSGEWNFSSLGGKSKTKAPAPAASGPKTDLDLSVKLIRITGGQLSLGRTGVRSKPLTLQDVNIEVKDFAAANQFPFTLHARIAGGGVISLDGKAGPISPTDTAASPLNASLKIDNLDLVGSGLTQTAPALAGLISFDGTGNSDGQNARISGKLKAEKLKLAKGGTPAKKPVQFEFAVDHNLRRRSGRLRKGDIRIGNAPASLTGTYTDQGETMALNMGLNGPKMAVSELTEMLPAMAIVLPRGSSLEGGTASAKISMEGPLDRLVTSGALSLDNTKLANFDMGRKLAFAEALAGMKANPDTEIQTLGATFRMASDGIQMDKLQLIVPAIGNLEGGGNVSPSNELAFKMRATVRNVSVPFFIAGTSSDPAFRPDVRGMATEGVRGLLKGFLSK
jgi:AsmA protein